MAYVTYTTTAIVCGTFDRQTADRSYRLFTRELGMLYADARSVRTEKSKQRQALQDFSLIKVSLVKGKTGWRIGSVSEIKNYYTSAVDKDARGSVVKLVRYGRRFLTGEETQSQLFDEYQTALTFFAGACEQRGCLERVFLQRVLAMLGYIRTNDVPVGFRDIALSAIAADEACIADNAIKLSIDRAEEASQL